MERITTSVDRYVADNGPAHRSGIAGNVCTTSDERPCGATFWWDTDSVCCIARG